MIIIERNLRKMMRRFLYGNNFIFNIIQPAVLGLNDSDDDRLLEEHIIDQFRKDHKGHNEKNRLYEFCAVFDGKLGPHKGSKNHEYSDGYTDQVIDLAVDGKCDE